MECGATNDRGVAHRLTRGEAGGECAELRLARLANLAVAAHDAALRTSGLGQLGARGVGAAAAEGA